MEIGEARKAQLAEFARVRAYLEKHFSSIGSEVKWRESRDISKLLGYVVSIDSLMSHFYGIIGYTPVNQ